jgi:hypothetical protein
MSCQRYTLPFGVTANLLIFRPVERVVLSVLNRGLSLVFFAGFFGRPCRSLASIVPWEMFITRNSRKLDGSVFGIEQGQNSVKAVNFLKSIAYRPRVGYLGLI